MPAKFWNARRKSTPDITRVTVYRTLELLKNLGLIDELDLLHLRGHRHFYESHGPRDHIHVACIRCGKVREFESELYEDLKRQIARDCDLEITITRTEVGGLCGDCRKIIRLLSAKVARLMLTRVKFLAPPRYPSAPVLAALPALQISAHRAIAPETELPFSRL